jgi:hypothetical protein
MSDSSLESWFPDAATIFAVILRASTPKVADQSNGVNTIRTRHNNQNLQNHKKL